MTLNYVKIEALGALGDGVSGDIFIPFGLPGEQVAYELDGKKAKIIDIGVRSDDRVEPECQYFTQCGGCVAQHMARELYGAWKSSLITQALLRDGLHIIPELLINAHGAGRRRVTFHARFVDGQFLVGFMKARSHDLVAIEQCPVLEPALSPAPFVALSLARALMRVSKPLDIQVTAISGGLDVDIRGHGALSDRDRQRLAQLALELDLARLSLHGELIVLRRPPTLQMGPAMVALPAGGFLQATALGEQILGDIIVDHLKPLMSGKTKLVADLFAGCGPFSLRIADMAAVHAVELSERSLMALNQAARGVSGLKPISTEVRDLFRRPVLELNRFDALVLDPPRAGALAQVELIARSSVPLVISVSCDAVTFSRDALVLVQGGYVLEKVIPVDQFIYSPHVEIVGIFRKAMAKRKRVKSC